MNEKNIESIEDVVKQCCVCNKYNRTLVKPPYLIVRTYLSRTCLVKDLGSKKLKHYATSPMWVKIYSELEQNCNCYFTERPGQKWFKSEIEK